MRRKLIKLMLLLLLLAAVVSYTLPLRDGKPLLSLSDIELPALPEVRLPQSIDIGGDGATGPVTFYRWRDRDGIWQYGSAPPPEGIPYESRTVDTTGTVLPSAPAAKTDQADGTPGGTTDAPSPYSADGIRKLFEDARSLRDMSHDREQQREKP